VNFRKLTPKGANVNVPECEIEFIADEHREYMKINCEHHVIMLYASKKKEKNNLQGKINLPKY
jgi:hypothetical protein